MPATSLVTNPRTLRALTRAGYIEWEDGTDRHWTGARVRRRYVAAGPRLDQWWQEFTHNRRRYRLTYVDGCFCPFVERIDTTAPRPAFV